MISIIIPALNEMQNHYFRNNIKTLSQREDCELIIIDGGSTDGTYEWVQKLNVNLYQKESNSRAVRINLGIEKATSDFVLILHPRSSIEIAGIDYLSQNSHHIQFWGGFTHIFDRNHPLLKFTSFWSNKMRADRRSIFYLDHSLFAPKYCFEGIKGFPEVEIFEDTIVSYRLRNQFGAGVRLPFLSTTSAIRFEKNGIFKQILLNQIMKILFYLRINHTKMNQRYEKNIELNSILKKEDGDESN